MFSQPTLNLARFLCLVLTAFALTLALGAVDRGVFAQGTNTGGFQGQVRDRATGAPIPGATVRFTNRDFGTTSTSITDSNGTYSKSSLPVGIYDIEVSANGYNTERRQETLFAMAKYFINPNPFDLTATVATPTPPVVVQPDPTKPTPIPPVVAPVVQEQKSVEALSLDARRVGIFGRDQVQGLPLGSTTLTRTFDELAFYVPGVNPPPQAIGNSVGPGVGGGVGTSGQFSVNGLRSRANNFTVDASDNNDEDIGVRRQGFFTLVPQPIESIQEFQIITLLAPAEFGRNLSAQVNAISRSGGNSFHGHVWGIANFDRLNARNYFDNDRGDSTSTLTATDFDGTVKPVFIDGRRLTATNDAGEKDKLTLLQGGFAVGGPIVRDKIFFFASGEGQFLDGVQERHFAVPTVGQRSVFGSIGGLQQCFPSDDLGNGGNCVPGYPTSVDGDAVFSLFPFPNDPSGIYGENTYTQALSTDARGYILSGRLDWNLFKVNGNQQTFTTRYNFTSDRRDLTDVGGALFSAIRPDVRTDNVSTSLNGSITNSVSNEARFSWGRTRLRFEEIPDATGFLRPVPSSMITNADERRFLLNAPLLFNLTLPTNCGPNGCTSASAISYGTTNFTTASNTRLGPIGQLIVSGFSPVGVDVFNFPQARTNDTFQFADTVRWQTGKHTLAFGADVRRVFLNSDLPRNSRPLVTFNGAACLTQVVFNCFGPTGSSLGYAAPQDLAASGAATGFFQSLKLPGTDASIRLSYTQFNFFVQDDWRFSPRLNVSLGLRYELNTTPKEADRKIESTFGLTAGQVPDPDDIFGIDFFQGLSAFLDGRDKIYEVDKNNFAPRIGIAWAPFKDTVFRGGYGIYYDQIIGSVVSQSRNVFPTFITANTGGGDQICGPNAFQLVNLITSFLPLNCFDRSLGGQDIRFVLPGTLNTINTSQASALAILAALFRFPEVNGTSIGTTLPTRELDTPFAHQYSAGIEHRLFGNTFLSVAYVGTTGRSLLRTTTPNLGNNYLAVIQGYDIDETGSPVASGSVFDPFTATANCTIFFSCRPNENIGPITQFETTGRSRYHSLQVGLRGRWSDRFRYNMNYIYGRAKDDVSDVFDLAGAFALPQNSLTNAGEYGWANFDVRHRFTYNFVYDLPSLKDEGGFAEFLLGGWTVSGVGKYYTGQPFTVNTVFDVNFDGNLTDRLDNLQFISTGGSRVSPLTLNCTGRQCRSMLAPFGEDGSVPRNNFRAPNVLDMDLSFAKRFTFAETQNIQLRIDLFNFINRANFGVPVRVLEAPGFGSANDTITPQRRIQFGLKYSF